MKSSKNFVSTIIFGREERIKRVVSCVRARARVCVCVCVCVRTRCGAYVEKTFAPPGLDSVKLDVPQREGAGRTRQDSADISQISSLNGSTSDKSLP